MATLIAATDDMWIGLHGPMKELIVDGERSISESAESAEYLRRKGITEIVRAPGQHAGFIERRGALLRDALRKVDDQLHT